VAKNILANKESAVAIEHSDNGSYSDRDTLFMLSGVALVVFGAGLIVSNPIAKRYLGQFGLADRAQAALPDLDRYLKLRAM
jgi:hypothetical protein